MVIFKPLPPPPVDVLVVVVVIVGGSDTEVVVMLPVCKLKFTAIVIFVDVGTVVLPSSPFVLELVAAKGDENCGF